MWILSSDGDFLRGKRVWLKPGKKYLFGRVKSDGVCHAIDHKSISRQHLVIEVGNVQPGDGSRIHAKSTVILHDQSSKGTVVDGEALLKQSKELGDRNEYVIKLGRYPLPLRITWCPVVLSFSFSSKQLKAKDPLAEPRSRLEELDIKTVIPYVTGKTSYVVQNKRNTAKGLQALINGKWIVDKSYIDAIVYAATPSDLENEEALCSLEEDFDAAWPDPRQHLPPRGREPTELPDSAYEPNSARLNVFEGYIFVFCEKSRYEELQGPITNGHGKALLYDIEYGRTTAEEIVDYLKRAGGSKGLACENDGNGGVILVQFQGGQIREHWAQDIQERISKLTGQRTLLPGEFLDAVLRNDASTLCRPVPKEVAVIGTERHAGMATQAMEIDCNTTDRGSANDDNAIAEESQNVPRPPKRSRTRTYVPKFKTFDDGFDMDSIPAYTFEQGDGEPVQEDTQTPTIEPIMEESPTNQSELVEDEVVSELLPGATAMKQRLGNMKRRDPTPPSEPTTRPKRPKLDVMEAARQRRKAVDEAAMAQKQEDIASFQAVIDGMNITEMQKLTIREEMPVCPRKAQIQTERSDDPRWDERWNGRKNFKKFRRKGAAGGAMRHRIQSVIVPLEEVKQKGSKFSDRHTSISHAVLENRRINETVDDTFQNTPVALQSQVSVPSAAVPSARPQKRSRESDESDDDGLRFRFRRKKR
ncbi:hypothetical protein VTO42DRAFT_7681 [Malbranchea cinnamomea]